LRAAAVAVAVAVRVGDGDSVEIGDGDGISTGDGEGVGASWANPTATKVVARANPNPHFVIRTLGIVTPVDLREQIVTRLAVGEKILIDRAVNELVVQNLKPGKVIEYPLSGVFSSGAGSH